MARLQWGLLGALSLFVVLAPCLFAAEPKVIVTTERTQVVGGVDAIDVDSPWAIATDVASTASDATVRVFYDRIYLVSPSSATVQVIDPDTYGTLTSYSVGVGTEPHDILVVSPTVAYVSRHASTSILKINPATGTGLGLIDLSALADKDGIPEMSMMARDGSHLFVQLQRLSNGTGIVERPSYLAVVDLDTDQLIDVDPDRPGVQGIALVGTIPKLRMHVEPLARRLFVSAPGPRLDVSGGIEEIDLRTLRSLGFILSEEYSIGDVGGFAMISADEGYAVGHTDIVESSHLFAFNRTPTPPAELFFTFGIMDVLIHDPASGRLFMPKPFHHVDPEIGVNVFDASTGARLTTTQIVTGAAPRDLTVSRSTTPGEARELRVTARNAVTGELALSYRPACGASNHNLVVGPLDQVSVYGYSGQVCDIGATGSFGSFDPGGGSVFFLVVGTDGGREGSYGGGASANERPEDSFEIECPRVQDLSFSCDRS